MLLHLAAPFLGLMVLAPATHAAPPCASARAEVIAAEGTVELQRAGATAWQATASGDGLCPGDTIRVALYSRAALRLDDDTVLRLDQDTTLSLPSEDSEHPTWVNVLRGLIHIISRDPRALKFTTPFANAGLEGTEFVVKVGESQADVTVLEGKVLVDNDQGAVEVEPGQRGVARAGNAPERAAAESVARTLQWALYYAPVLASQATGAAATANLAARAAARLTVGRVAEAEAEIAALRAADPRSPSALALESAIALGQNDKHKARALAEQAVEYDAQSAPALLALSYAQQAQFQLEAARQSAERAVRQAPDNALAQARLAELELSLSHIEAGRAAAVRAVALDPNLGYAQTMLGFAALNALDYDGAAAAFRKATQLEESAPLPRLGLGLTLIRQGDFDGGKHELELAVLLDPDSAVTRSYVAKAYYDARHTKLPASQLALAKSFDPTDPTAFLYDAIRKQTANRPVEALRDLQHSIELNDEEVPFRSSLRLDEDLAARSASLGRIYRDLGFEQLALADGWRSVSSEPSNYSGHRLLADSYTSLPRHQIARVNELYQAQLLQPFNVTPQPPELAETSSFLLDALGPSELAYDEFNPLLAQNRVSVHGSAVGASNGTNGEQIVAAGSGQRFSYSAGQFRFSTDGFRENNDFTNEVQNLFFQTRPNDRISLQAELRSTSTDQGDLQLLFDPEDYAAELRQEQAVDSLRLGAGWQMNNHNILLSSVIRQKGSLSTRPFSGLVADLDFTGTKYEVTNIREGKRWNVTSGFSYSSNDSDEQTTIKIDVPFPPFSIDTVDTNRESIGKTSAYAYGELAATEQLTLSFGASIDKIRGQLQDRRRANPKVGLLWKPTAGTTVRAAAFRTLQGPVVSKQNIQPRLEPTEIAGFNQFFFDSEGEEAWRYGVGIDQRLRGNLFGGAEVSERDLEIPRTFISTNSPTNQQIILSSAQENLARGYLYWTPHPELALGAEYQYERFNNHGQIFAEGYSKLRTHRLPLSVRYFAPSGWSGGVTATYLDQRGDFGAPLAGTDAPTEVGADRFWVVDGTLGYRLPERRGRVSLTIHNLFDRRFNFQDTDPENPTIMPERMVSLRFTLAY